MHITYPLLLRNNTQTHDALASNGQAITEISVLKGQIKVMKDEIEILTTEIEHTRKEKAKFEQERDSLQRR